MKLFIAISLLSPLIAIANGKVVCKPTSGTSTKDIVEVICPEPATNNCAVRISGSDPCCATKTGSTCDANTVLGNLNTYTGPSCEITCLDGCVPENTNTVCTTVSDDVTTSAPTVSKTSAPVICSGDAFGKQNVLCPSGKSCAANQGLCMINQPPSGAPSSSNIYTTSGFSDCKLWCDGGCTAHDPSTTCVPDSNVPSPTPGGDPGGPDQVCSIGTFSCPNGDHCCTSTACGGFCTNGDDSVTLSIGGGGRACMTNSCIPSGCSFTCDSGCTCSNPGSTTSPTISSADYHYTINTNVVCAGLLAVSTLVISSCL